MTYAEKRSNGRSHLRHIVLVEEACDTEKDAHGEQPHAPEHQRLLLPVALDARSSLPGQSKHPKER